MVAFLQYIEGAYSELWKCTFIIVSYICNIVRWNYILRLNYSLKSWMKALVRFHMRVLFAIVHLKPGVNLTCIRTDRRNAISLLVPSVKNLLIVWMSIWKSIFRNTGQRHVSTFNFLFHYGVPDVFPIVTPPSSPRKRSTKGEGSSTPKRLKTRKE